MIIAFSCSNKTQEKEISFYYWKSTFKLNQFETNTLEKNNVKTIYLRYFDIDFENTDTAAKAVATLQWNDTIKNLNIVPVIFIKNRTFKHVTQAKEIENLAKHVHQKISSLNQLFQCNPNEIQFDCDWSESTKEPYFAFLNEFKKINQINLSATIRLHQIKYYTKTGIPPVNKGVLMHYNMGDINTSDNNSIYEKKNAEKYIYHLKTYPLKTDIALPIFAWGIQIRNNQVVELLNKININEFKTDTNFILLKSQRLKAKRSFFKASYYFVSGDEIKIEEISENDLLEMSESIKNNTNNNINKIIFYDLDSVNFKRYDEKIFEKVLDNIR